MNHDHNQSASLDQEIAAARHAYRMMGAPEALEFDVIARMRAASGANIGIVQVSTPSTISALPLASEGKFVQRLGAAWQRFKQTRYLPAMAGALATLTLVTLTAPWWLHFVRESREVATPFMLVSPQQSAQLDVSQMLRVNVTREAMLDFGIPVPPQRLSEPVKAEMLMGARGDVLAVRFVEPNAERRWRWQFH
jgi:hypothetical protein